MLISYKLSNNSLKTAFSTADLTDSCFLAFFFPVIKRDSSRGLLTAECRVSTYFDNSSFDILDTSNSNRLTIGSSSGGSGFSDFNDSDILD